MGSSDAAVDAFIPPDANPSLTEVALIPATINRDVDLLFVIDDSPTMLDKQTNLKNSFPSFVAALKAGTGLPSLHIGVISTDMGTMGADDTAPGPAIGSGPGSCSSVGKDGALRTATGVSGNYIVDANGTTNYTGTLESAFSALASIGAAGCGFEQPLHALRRSLMNPANTGFLREMARLGIVVLSDEDDCSVSHSTLMGSDTSTLGPLQSFRCARFGVTCDVGGMTTDQMNVVGVKMGCRSNEQSAYMTDVGRYKTLIEGLKPDARDVLFTAIIGDTSKVEVELRTPPGGGTAIPSLVHSCTYTGSVGVEVADPGVRLAHLATSLRSGAVTSVCNANLSPVMTDLGQRIKGLVGDPCILRAIADPPACEVWDMLASGGQEYVPPCTGTSGSPCFTITTDAATCPGAQNLKVDITRATPASAGTWASVRCAL